MKKFANEIYTMRNNLSLAVRHSRHQVRSTRLQAARASSHTNGKSRVHPRHDKNLQAQASFALRSDRGIGRHWRIGQFTHRADTSATEKGQGRTHQLLFYTNDLLYIWGFVRMK